MIHPFAEGKGIYKRRLKQLDSFGPKEKIGKGVKGGRGGARTRAQTEPQQKRESFVPPPSPTPNTTAKVTT